MKDMKLIPRVTVNTLVRELGGIYTAAVKSGWPLKRIPTPMLWGPPGVGKSAGAEQLAAAIETGTGKRAAVTEVRLLLFSPIDLRGIPVANRDKTLAEWLKPAVFDMDPSEECVNLLFLDELSAAPPAVQAAAYQLTLDRRIGEHRLPDNCIVIGAGNRTSDRSAAYRMPNALANRMQHYEIAVDFPSWQEWAIRNDVHPQVLGYLAFDNSRLYDEEVREDQTAFASPRSWMFVSDILNIMGERAELDALFNQISACVGTDTALSFLAWCRNHSELPCTEEIFQGKCSKYPSSPDALYALTASMAKYVEARSGCGSREEITETELDNMSAYAARFPADYQACLYRQLWRIEGVRRKLMRIPGFRLWMRRR